MCKNFCTLRNLAVQGLSALYIGTFPLPTVGYTIGQYHLQKTAFESLYSKTLSVFLLLLPLAVSTIGCLVCYLIVCLRYTSFR